MNALKCFLYITCLLGVVVVSGCVIVSGEPVAVEVEEIEIGYPPPPPTMFNIWIGGHHVVRSGKWVWVEGCWARPVRRGASWVPAHTRRSGEVWMWRPGHWH